MEGAQFLDYQDISELEKSLKKSDGFPDLPVSYFNQYNQSQISQFCVQEGLYQVVTSELLDCIDKLIGDSSAIEIGSGSGWLGSHLNIVMTDNKQQERPEIKMLYEIMKQPVTKYHKDIVKLDGNAAVKKLRPKVVVAAWITAQKDYQGNPLNATGVIEEPIVEAVDYYIVVGNDNTHNNKAILHKYDHYRIKADWILSRSMSKEANTIYIIAKNLDLVPIDDISDMGVVIDKVEV